MVRSYPRYAPCSLAVVVSSAGVEKALFEGWGTFLGGRVVGRVGRDAGETDVPQPHPTGGLQISRT